MKEQREKIRHLLSRNHLSQVWLINILADKGIEVDKTVMSAVLNGSRKGPKAVDIINQSLEVLGKFESIQL